MHCGLPRTVRGGGGSARLPDRGGSQQKPRQGADASRSSLKVLTQAPGSCSPQARTRGSVRGRTQETQAPQPPLEAENTPSAGEG